jgi:type IVB pilus formation R64 PilN family outer membrane protein
MHQGQALHMALQATQQTLLERVPTSVLTALLLLLLAVMMSGCTGLARTAENDTDETQRRAATHMSAVSPASAPVIADGVSVRNGYFIAQHSVRLVHEQSLPPVFSSGVTFNRRVKSLSEFAERVSVLSGVPARVTPDAAQASAGRGGATPSRGAAIPAPSAAAAPTSLQVPLPSPSGAGYAGGAAGASYAGGGAYLVYREGTLKGLLDMAAARFGVSWKYAEGSIEFHYLDTRTFQVNAVPGESALSANVGTASGGDNGSSGGVGTGVGTGSSSNSSSGPSSGNNQSTVVHSQLSVFASLEKSVAAMLSSQGSVVSSPATGTLTVTDTPPILARVEKFIERENRVLGRQVLINVTVLSVSLSDDDNYGLNWDVVFSELSRRYGIKNTFGTDAGGTAFSASVLDTSSSKFAGSSVLINALSTQGRVRKQTSASVAALNHQPVPVSVVRQTAYLKSSQTTVSANVGSTTSLNPGVVSSGFTMTVLPSVLDNGTVILQFSTDISSLRQLTTVRSSDASGASQIQTPEVDTRNFLQRVAMKSGQTLVVSGFEQMEGSVDRQGVGTPTNFLFGGGMTAHTNKDVIVILVTPIAMPGA